MASSILRPPPKKSGAVIFAVVLAILSFALVMGLSMGTFAAEKPMEQMMYKAYLIRACLLTVGCVLVALLFHCLHQIRIQIYETYQLQLKNGKTVT